MVGSHTSLSGTVRATWRALARASVVLAAVALGAAGLATVAPRPADAVGSSPIAPAMGMATGGGILWQSNAEFARDMDAIAASGATWIRVDFDWASIQYESPTTWRWDRATDRIVAAARARGLTVLGQLGYAPPWARPADCPTGSNKCMPTDGAAYGTFARAAAARYGANATDPAWRNTVRAWEIWNEPNHKPFAQPKPNLDRYVGLLKAAYAGIKAVDPGATVVTGGLSPAPDAADGSDIAPMTFLQGIYARGGRGSFDAVGHHPYSFPYDPSGGQSWNAFTQTGFLYQIMVANGDGAKKVWGTEAGAPTGNDEGRSVDEATQAAYVTSYYRSWTTTFGAFTGPLFWHMHRDSGPDLGYYDDNFGLLRRDWSMKPAFGTFLQLATQGLPGGTGQTTTTTAPAPTTTTTAAAPTTTTTTRPAIPGAIPGVDPIGWLDGATTGPDGVTVRGWAIDPESTAPISVQLWMEGFRLLGTMPAAETRAPLAATFPAYGSEHGFTVTAVVPEGPHTVCAVAENVGAGTSRVIGCRDLVVTASPFGYLDAATSGIGGLRVRGWAADGDVDGSIPVHLWMDGATWVGATTASVRRPDVAAAFPGYGADHGFEAAFSVPAGPHRVCAYGINAGARGANTLLGCADVVVRADPLGALDAIARVPGGLRVTGWAIDPETAAPIAVHAYVGSAGTSILADAERADIGAAFPAHGSAHGFDALLAAPAEGPVPVCAFAINVAAGRNTLLGCRTVVVAHAPIGALDGVTNAGDRVHVAGWAIDPDRAGAVTVHVYVDGVATAVIADGLRTDLLPIFPAYGAMHGFAVSVPVRAGPHTVCVYALDDAGGPNPSLGCRVV
ncbi:MAG: hypothetical protein ACKOZL_07335 [Actinomycetes bacterium]